MTTIYTLGHSSHAAEHFVRLLQQHGVGTLVDVRSQPYSRWAPQFRKSALARTLGAERIEYVFLGHALGGRPEGVEYYGPDGMVDYARRAQANDFRAGLEQLILVASGAPTAVMCAEEDPERCHRRLLVAPALRERDVSVIHIRGDGRLEPDETRRDPSLQLPLFRS